MKRITAPVQGLNGAGVGGLQFVDSVATTDDSAIIAYCESSGYLVEDMDEPEIEPVDTDTNSDSTDENPDEDQQEEPPPNLEEMTVAELKELASQHQLDISSVKKKSELIELLDEALSS